MPNKVNINQLLACAMVERCSLFEASKKIDAPHEVLCDAVMLRMSTAIDFNITDYYESITESFKRLEAAN